jgi:SAM-dependent methyltransferase
VNSSDVRVLPDTTTRRDHWDAVYAKRDEQLLSWYQADPRMSVRLIEEQATAMPTGKDSAVIDVGGGTSALAARLAGSGFTDATVLDISAAALAAAARHADGARVTVVQADLLAWRPARRYHIWHDRAVFHFLTDPADRAAYLATLRAALADGGAIIMAAFAADGPARCSGLPVARYDAAGLAAELTAAYGEAVTVTGHRRELHHTPSGVIQPFTWITARLEAVSGPSAGVT